MSSPLSYDFLLDLPVDADDPTLLSLRDRQLRTLFEMALDGMAIADDRGRYLDVNPAACELFGLERDELLGRCIFEFAEPGFNFPEAWQEFQQQEKVRGEFRLVRADGDIRIVEYAATANFLPHRHLSVMRDITERKRAEVQVQELTQQLDVQVSEPVSELEQTQAQLRQSQQRLESILNSVEGVVWSIHPETFETIYINPAVEQIFGCSVAEFFANPNLWFEIIHPDDQSNIANAFVRLKEHGKTRTEYRIIRRDGQVRWLSVNSYLVYDETGKPIRIDGITTDISDRIESQTRLEQIARHIPGVIYQLRQRPDGTFHFPYSSERIREIYGVSPEEVCEDGSKIFSFLHPDDIDRVSQSILESAQHLTPWYCEYRVCLPNGRMLWLVGNATPQRELDGATLWHGYIRDITDSKRAEANSQRLLAILETTPDLIGTADLMGKTLYLNRSWRNLLDNNDAAIAEMEVSKAHPDWALDIILNQGLPEAAHSGNWQGETAILDPTGREIPVSQSILAHKSTEGKVEYFSTIIRDITESKATELALQISENKFRSIIENLNDMVYIINPDATFSYVSPQFKNVMGYELAELLERAFGQWIHPEDLPICVDAVQRSLQGEKLRGIEYRVLHQDGNYYWHSSNLSALRDDEGQVVSCLGIARYIHDQKQVEIALQESNSRWQLAIEGAGDGTWDWNLKTNEAIFSRQWKAMLGYAEHEIVNALEEWDSRVHPEDKAQCYEDFAKHLNGETSAYRNEHRLRCKDGSYKWILDRGQVIEWDKEGQPLRFIGTHSDISDRKCAEAKLIEITQLQQAILDGANYTIISTDINGIIKTINAAAQRFLGYSSAEVVDKLTPSIFHDLEEVKQRAAELTAELGKPIMPGFEVFVAKARLGMLDEYEWSYIRKDGSRFPVQLSVTALQDQAGTITGFLGIASDITARKQVETQLKEISERLSLSLKSGGIGCWEWDIVQNRLIWDDRIYEIYGINKNSEAPLTYDIWKESLHPDDRVPLEKLVHKTLLGQAELDTEFRSIHPNGSIYFIKAFGIVQRDAEGNPQKLIGVNFDISDRKEAEKNLRQNEQKYHQILDAITDMVLVKGPQSRIVWANKAFRDYYGLNSEQLKDMIDAPFNNPDYTLQYIRDDAYVFETGQSLEIEEPATRYDGKVQMFNTIKSVIRNEAGEKILTVGVSRDISDRKQAEDALRTSEEKLRSLFDLCPVGIALNDMQGRFLEVNSAAETIYGYSLEELNQLSYFDLTPEKYADDETRQLELLSTIGRFGPYQKEYIRKDGSLLPVELLGVLVTGKDESQYIWSIIVDISDRKRQEQALRLIVEGTAAKTGEEFFKSCVQYLAQVLEVRYAFIAEFVDSEKLIAKTLAFWAGDDFGDNFTYNLAGTPCKNVDINAKVCRYSTSVQCLFPEDDDLVALQAESYAGLPIVDAAGNRLGLLAVLDTKPMVQDIEMQSAILRIFATRAGAEIDRIQAEATVRQSEIQLRQQTEELETTLKKLQNTQTQLIQSEKMSSLGQLVAGIAHEINNPVSFIYSNIQPATDYASDLIDLIHLYQQHYPSPPQIISDFTQYIDFEYLVSDFSNLLESMKTGATRISDIVKSLRTFSRLDEADLKKIDIHENLESTLIILQNRLNSSTVKTEISVVKNYGNLPLIECYGGLLNQVFLNLLVNSIDAIEQKRSSLELTEQLDYIGCITITTSINLGNQVIMSIQDNGCGMSPEVQKKIFNPFFTTKPVGKGTGMGLATSYQIVNDNHVGRLRCCSAPGEGTEFVIELPVRQQK